MAKARDVSYRVLTAIVLLPTSIPAVILAATGGAQVQVQSMQQLGYPLYLLRVLGVAMLMGGVAIVWGKSTRLKEWAYAGYTFLLLGATISHLLSRNYAHAALPLALLAVWLSSYFLWLRRPLLAGRSRSLAHSEV